MDEFGPLNLQPHPGKQWAPTVVGKGDADSPRRRRRATYNRPHGVRHLLAGYDLPPTGSTATSSRPARAGPSSWSSAATCGRCYPPEVRIAIVLDNFTPHLSTKKDQRVGEWAEANNVELAYTPTNSSWLNRIEAQFQRPALLRPRRHRPRHPHRAGHHDPPLHHLAQPQRTRHEHYATSSTAANVA